MGIERRRALRSRPPAGQRIAVLYQPAGGPALAAHLFDLSEVGLAGFFTREAAQGLALGSGGQLRAEIRLPDGLCLELDCPVVLRQTRPMAAGYLVGLELKLDGSGFDQQRERLRLVVDQWLRAAHSEGPSADSRVA